MTTALVQSLNKRHMKHVFHNKIRMIIHDQKTLSLIFKSSHSQMIFTIGVLKHFAIFTRKHLCWSYFLIKSLKRDSNIDVFLEYCKIFKNPYFEELLRTAASVLLIIKLVIVLGICLLFLMKNIMRDSFY